MKQKQVLFIGMSPNMGGIETFMMNVFMKLEGHGFHFTFINTSKKKLAYQREILNNGGTIKKVLINTSLLGHLFRYKRALNFFKSNHNYDIIHLNAVTINVLFWLKAANKFNIPKLIIHSHNDGIIYKSLIKKILAKILNWCNIKYLKKHSNIKELAVSCGAGEWMFHNNRFKIIKNGIDTNKFKFNPKIRRILRNKLGINNKDKVIITVARLEPQKNYYRILRIFTVAKKQMSNLKLVIVGNGSEYASLVKYTHKLNIYNSVIFVGAINDVNKILNIADIMLMPSKYEGFPFALLEAQSNGVPALVSKGAVPLSSNVTGTLRYVSLKRSNIYWANIINNMLDKHMLYSIKVEMNKKMNSSIYNLNNSIKKIMEIYF